MSAAAGSRLFDFVCEAAGLLGLIAAFMVCMLAFAGAEGAVFWICAGVAGLGLIVYIVHQLAARLVGPGQRTGRQLVLALLVPVIAVLVTGVVAGERAGLFFLPFGHKAIETQREVISVKKNADGTVETTTRPADEAQ